MGYGRASRSLSKDIIVAVAAPLAAAGARPRGHPQDPAAISTFHTLNVVLGTVVGETLGMR